MNAQLLRELAVWARARGISKPTTPDGMKALLAKYIATGGSNPTWDEIPDEHPTHLTWDGAKSEIVDARHGDPDDFDVLIEQRERALVEAHGDDLARDAILQEDQHASLQAQAPFQRTNPVSILQGTLGGQALVPRGADPVTVCQWVGEDPESTAMIVSLAAVGQANQFVSGGSFPVFRPYAILSWGTRGYLTSAEVDIANGVQAAISGSQITVQVVNPTESLSTPPYNLTSTALRLSGLVSFGSSKSSQTPVTRTVYLDTTTPVAFITIPAFAKTLFLLKKNLTDEANVLIFDSDFNQITKYQFASGAQQTQPLYLPNGSIFVKSLDAAGTSNTVCAAVFGLSL